MICIVDKYIPFVQGRLEHIADRVVYLDPKEITHEAIQDADAMLIRTRTRCDKNLLHDTSVHFIGTATIGTDHIDSDYCLNNNIKVCNAPGCNARGVAQYVESALVQLGIRNWELGIGNDVKTIGIIGVGHVGTLVYEMAKRLGLNILLYDPPRQKNEGGNQWTTDLHEVAKHSDIITIHAPLTKEGKDKTYHLIDSDFLELCKPNAIIINAARGGIIDEEALISIYSERARRHAPTMMRNNPQLSTTLNFQQLSTFNNFQLSTFNFQLILDTWENEPNINTDLLNIATIATPHIAGYSDEGKRNATRMILEQLADYFHCKIDTTDLATSSEPLPIYDIMKDDLSFRANPQDFERQRQQYHFR